jgi:plastocyanin
VIEINYFFKLKHVNIRGMLHSKKILFFILLGILIILAVFFLYPKPHSQTKTILLKENGFEPQTITINKGDSIEFKSEQNRQFWPASDLHPTHGIYPEFDPQEPINASDIWKFRFDKKGSWRFHDHLQPFFRGTINVE